MDYSKNGKCPEGCSICCTNMLPLSADEINKIRKYLKTHDIDIHNYNNLNGYVDKCPFIEVEDGKCQIYEVRPEMCRYYYCNNDMKDGKEFNHKGKHIINILETFKPGSFMGEGAPSVERLDMIYQMKKQKAGK